MSGLAGILSGRHEPGVFRWQAKFEVTSVAHAAERAGWRMGHLDTWQSDTKSDFLGRIGEALGFPSYYGHNFDALADCLADVGKDGVGTVLLWDGWGQFARHDSDAFEIAIRALKARASEARPAPFAALLRGEGPDLGRIRSID